MFVPKGLDTYRSHWTSYFPNGEIDIRTDNFPRQAFKKKIQNYDYTLDTTEKILKAHNNLAVPSVNLSGAKVVGKTRPGIMENFCNRNNNFYLVILIILLFFVF